MIDGRFVTHGEVTKREIPGVGLVELKYCRHCNCLTEAPSDADVKAWWVEHTHQGNVTEFANYWLDMYVAHLVEKSEREWQAWQTDPGQDPEGEEDAHMGAVVAGRFDYELRPFLVDVGLTDRMDGWGPMPIAHFARALAAHQQHVGRQDLDAVLYGLREVFDFLRWAQAQGCAFAGAHPFAGLADLSPEYLPVDVETWRAWVRVVTGSPESFLNHVVANLPRVVSLPRAIGAHAPRAHKHSQTSCAVCSRMPETPAVEYGPVPTDDRIPF